MATAANISVVANRWVNRGNGRPEYLAALEPNSAEALKLLETRILGLPDFEVTCTTDSNDATSPVLNLSDLGVPFGVAQVLRRVWFHAYTSDDNDSGFMSGEAVVRGDPTTPVIDGTTLDVDNSIGAETINLAVAANKVVVNAVGITADNLRWHIKVWVDPIPVPLAFLA